MPTRLCLEPGCPNVATWRGRCPLHARERNRETRSQNASLYNSKRWKLTRRRKLTDTPLCERCGRVAAHVHHRIDLQQGGDPWNQQNLEALCASCHNSTTAKRQHKN